MWAGVNAVQAESAIQITRLLRLEESQFAASPRVIAADAVVCRAIAADVGIANLHFERRDERLPKVELTDRADVFAEARAPEQPVNDERRGEIADDDPRRPPRAVPKTERLIGPQVDRQQRHGEPFGTQPFRPMTTRGEPTPPEIARQGERASHTEEI